MNIRFGWNRGYSQQTILPNYSLFTAAAATTFLIHFNALSHRYANNPSSRDRPKNWNLNYSSGSMERKNYLLRRERNQLHPAIQWRNDLQSQHEEEGEWDAERIEKRLVLSDALHEGMSLPSTQTHTRTW